jgi:hypothetical protein
MSMKKWWNVNDGKTERARQCSHNVAARHGTFLQPLLQCKSNVNCYKLRVCVCMCVALLTQLAPRMRRIIMPSVACPSLQYFSFFQHHPITVTIFGGGGGRVTRPHIMCVLIFSANFDRKRLVLRRIQRHAIIS